MWSATVDLNFNEAVIDKITNFNEMTQISHINKNRNLFRLL